MKAINPRLKDYIEAEILPRYREFDSAHRIDHVQEVIRGSLELALHYDVDVDMVYTVAAYHDTGLCGGREEHHILSGRILRGDATLKHYFSPDKIEIMAQAVEDHRASSSHAPRSIYGRIVAEADRIIDGPTIVRRTIRYGLSHYPQLDKEGHYLRFLEHMAEKYAQGGYLKLWIPQSPNAERLASFQQLLEDPAATREMFEREWNSRHNAEFTLFSCSL